MNWFESFWQRLNAARAGGGDEFLEPLANFTPRAQQALGLARQEASRFNHHFIGTEHVLLGLIKLGQGTAVNVLGNMGLDPETVRREVEKQVGTGPEEKKTGHIPYTPRVKKVLALAAKEAKALNHTYVGTEHILLGLLREGDGVAARVLKGLDVDIEVTRQHILRELDPNFPAAAGETTPSQKPESRKPPSHAVDLTKRYDIYCADRNEEVVVYRNALFKGVKKLFSDGRSHYDIFYEFIELEEEGGKTIFVARSSVIKFCEHGVKPGSEGIASKEQVDPPSPAAGAKGG